MTTKKRTRGNGEGSLYQLPVTRRADGSVKKGRWIGSVATAGGPRRKVSGATRDEANDRLQDLRRSIRRGEPAVNQRLTVGSYLASWLLEAAPRVRASTRLRRAGLVHGQLVPHIGHIPLAKLTRADVARMLAALEAGGPGRKPLSPQTAAHARSTLRKALNDAEKGDLVTRNVVRLTDPPKVPAPSPTVLPAEDIHRVLDAVAGTAVENAVTLALYSGMRSGEVLGLRWSDVSFDTGCLTVRVALQRIGTTDSLIEPKSKASRRTLQLPGPALDALRDERRRQVERQLAAGGRWKPTIRDLVFTDALGRPLKNTTTTRRFQTALRQAGVPVLRFHDLRHLHASSLLAAGTDLAVVSKVLGHSSISLTASTYAGILPALQRDAAERFAQYLSRSS